MFPNEEEAIYEEVTPEKVRNTRLCFLFFIFLAICVFFIDAVERKAFIPPTNVTVSCPKHHEEDTQEKYIDVRLCILFVPMLLLVVLIIDYFE